MARVAELMVERLIAAGVRRIYGVVGDSLNAFTESLRKQGHIEWIGVRHEEVAAFAAGAEAHLTGSLAVCAGTSGPGNMHLMNGLYDCHRSRVPVLAIAAQIPSREIGTGYFQETRPDILFKDCSVFCEAVTQPEQMPRLLDVAIRAAIGQRGVAVLTLPGDLAFKQVPAAPPSSLTPSTPAVRPSDEELSKLARLLERGRRSRSSPGGMCGRSRRAHRNGSNAEGADRARDARQGARRIRQPVQCRNDRAHRLLVRLLRDDGLRCPAHAGHGLPVSEVLPGASEHRAGRHPPREPRATDSARSRARRRRPGDPCRPPSAASPAGRSTRTWIAPSLTTRRHAPLSTIVPSVARTQADSSRVPHAHRRPACRRRCRVHV